MTLHSGTEVIICVDGFFFEAREPLRSEILAEARRQSEQAGQLAPSAQARKWRLPWSTKSVRGRLAEARGEEATVSPDQTGTPR